MVVDPQQSYMVLSELSAGSSYIISVTTTQGRAQSDALVSIITTGTQLDKLNVLYMYFLVALIIENTNKHTMECLLTAVPAPPTHLQVVSVSDTRAVLQWTPSLGKVDRFIISYESSKSEHGNISLMTNDKVLMTTLSIINPPSCHSS